MSNILMDLWIFDIRIALGEFFLAKAIFFLEKVNFASRTAFLRAKKTSLFEPQRALLPGDSGCEHTPSHAACQTHGTATNRDPYFFAISAI